MVEPLQDSYAYKLRHSAAHLLAQAVKHLYPEVKLGIGPVTEEGFYYDFLRDQTFTPEDLKAILAQMKDLAKKGFAVEKRTLGKKEVDHFLKQEKFKKELYNELEEKGEKVTFYGQGDFVDLCRGSHVENTKELKHFALTKISGAYWRGDAKNVQLQRIYGVIFETEKELKDYLQTVEDAEKFNHRKIGEDLELFTHFDLIGKGLPVWLPKGEIIRREIEAFAIATEDAAGYIRVCTPHLAKKELFVKSGHLPYYADTMYPPMETDDGTYYLKAMNCPMHHLIFAKKVRSYRDMPLRIAEYGTVYRNELSGTLSGLGRVRVLHMNDAHVYCRKDQIEHEVESVLQLTLDYFKVFGLKEYWFRLSLHDPQNKEKYIDQQDNWAYVEETLRQILKRLGLSFVEAPDEAAFYGPKIDVQFKNIYGKEDTVSTIQLDFAAKERFDLHYDDANGFQNKEVFVIHRAPLSTHERFIAFLIEHYKGKFPLWLNPVQVKVVTITDDCKEYAKEITGVLKDHSIRAELDDRSDTIARKVRAATLEHINYILTVGEKEVGNGTVAVRDRDGKVQYGLKLKDFIDKLQSEIRMRC